MPTTPDEADQLEDTDNSVRPEDGPQPDGTMPVYADTEGQP